MNYLIYKIRSSLGVFGVLIALAMVIALIVLWPLLIIWSVNTLFPVAAIPYTFWTWVAVLIFTMTFGKANVKVNKA